MKKRHFILAILLIVFFNIGQIAHADVDLPVSDSTQTHYIYRYWSPVFKAHFYTMDYEEGMRVANEDDNWNFEKVAYSAYKIQAEGTVPIYRFWSPIFHGHFYTANSEEWMRVKDTDSNWNYEWIAFYAYPNSYQGEARTVYRFWSPVFRHHFFTIDEAEMERVRDFDPNWEYEGEAFKVPIDDSNQTVTGGEDELVEIQDSAVQVDDVDDVSDHYASQVVPGQKLIAIKVYLRNISDQPITYSMDDFVVTDENGQEYSPQLIQEPFFDSQGTLDPDDSVEGFLTFSLPQDLEEIFLNYTSDAMELLNNKIDLSLNITPSVVIISHSIEIDQFSGKKIMGTIKNKTSEPVRLVKINAHYFAEDGQEISNDFTYAEGTDIEHLQPGETADFRVWYDTSPDVSYYSLDLTWQTG